MAWCLVSRAESGKKWRWIVDNESVKRFSWCVWVVCRIKSEFGPEGDAMSSASIQENETWIRIISRQIWWMSRGGHFWVEDVPMLVDAFDLWVLANNKRFRQVYLKRMSILSYPAILIYVGMSRYVKASIGNPRRSFRNSAVNAPRPWASRASSDSPHAAMRTWDSKETGRASLSRPNVDGSSSTQRTRVKASLLVPEPEWQQSRTTVYEADRWAAIFEIILRVPTMLFPFFSAILWISHPRTWSGMPWIPRSGE